MFTKPDKPET